VAKRPTGLKIDDAAWPLLQAFVSYWGITDADGAAGGGTLVCSDLVNQPDFDGNQVVIISGAYAGQARDINGATDGGTVTVATVFGGQIVTGTLFAILALRTVPAEVAALAADVGDMADAATADDLSDVTTTSLHAKVRRLLLRLSSDAFTATIQGAARTELDTILYQLATYISALGAAYSATVNPGGAARDNIEQTLEDLGDMLAGAAGIVTYPARSLPGNAVSIAEVLRYIAEVKPEWDARTSGTHTTASANEETILTTAYTVPGLFYFNLSLRNMVAGDDFTIRVYKRVDGTNYDLKSEQQFTGSPTIKVYEIEGIYTDGTEFIRITIQRNSATDRAFPYSYNFLRQPVA